VHPTLSPRLCCVSRVKLIQRALIRGRRISGWTDARDFVIEKRWWETQTFETDASQFAGPKYAAVRLGKTPAPVVRAWTCIL
jgi:hypothetical protein